MINIPGILVYLNQLNSLDLSSNPIKSIDILWKGNLPNLKYLNLSACWLKKLPFEIPSFHLSLNEFILDGNFLNKNPPNFSIFFKLKILSLIGNEFFDLPFLPKGIEKLYFRLNSSKIIPETSLQYLDLSYCSLNLNFQINSHLIVYLDLSHCEIYNKFHLPSLPMLSQLFLNHNIITNFTLTNSKRLIELDLSYNCLDEIPKCLNNLPLLRILSLSHNLISQIPSDLTFLKRIESLDISHNLIISPLINLPSKINSLRTSFNFSISFEALPPSLNELDTSFCNIVSIPPVINPLKSISLYFIPIIIFSNQIKSISNEKNYDLDNSLILKNTFQRTKSIFNSFLDLGFNPLMNQELGKNIGCSATEGRSTKYEDNFLYIKDNDITYVGVFDGHVGEKSAFISAETFSSILNSIISKEFNSKPEKIKKAFNYSFSLVNDELRRREVKDGTTVVIVGVNSNKIICANLGDSLALLINKNNSSWLTKPHRPNDKIEYSKLRKVNKSVSNDWRVDGKLAISRSLGDFWCCDGMFESPDVSIFNYDENALSIVLACDGLWDYLDEGVICNLVRNVRDPVKASRLLQDFAFVAGSHDSISVIVFNLNVK